MANEHFFHNCTKAAKSEDIFLLKWSVIQIHACVRLGGKLSKERLQEGKCSNITSCVCLHARLLLKLW